MAGHALTQEQRQRLTDTALRDHARAAAKVEHQAMTEVIEAIREVNRRKLFLKLNYKSLFDYVRKDLGYEGGTAQSRIDAARLFEEVPSIKADFEQGKLKITQVSVFSQSVKQKIREEPGFKLQAEAKAEILEAVKSLDVKQTQKLVAEKLDLKVKDFEKARVQSDESVRLEITLTKEQMEDLARIKDLISHTHPTANWSQVIAVIAKEYRKRKDPLVFEDQRKKKRTTEGQSKHDRTAQSDKATKPSATGKLPVDPSTIEQSTQGNPNNVRMRNASSATAKKNPDAKLDSTKPHDFRSEVSPQGIDFEGSKASTGIAKDKASDAHFGSEVMSDAKATAKRTRDRSKIPTQLRREVLKRDGSCRWVNLETGEIRESTFQLEVDHKHSRWAGGTDDPENLRALCDHHNRLKYQREVGLH